MWITWVCCSNCGVANRSLRCQYILANELNRLGRQHGSQANLLICEHNYVGFNLADGVGTDIEAFDHLRTRGLALLAQRDEPAGRHCCQAALALYRGDLCGDENIHTVIERERLRIAMLDLLSALADHAYRCGDLTGALGHLQRILVYRPYREGIHRQLMAHYAQMGLRTRALNQYRVCERILAAEFAIEPEAATKQLYQQLCRGETAGVSPLLCEGVSA